MFFEELVTEWGEVLLIPTKSGEALLTIIIAIMLLIAMIGIQFHGHPVSVRKLAYCALTIGIATLLANINITLNETGGNITLFSMLIMALPGFWFGPIAGIATGMAYGVFQILIDPYLLFPTQIAVDYLLAFGALGLSGCFAKSPKYGLVKGYILGVLGRYVFAVISGAVFFGYYAWEGWQPLPYSLVYNAQYIFPEAVVTVILLLIPAISRLMDTIKSFVLESTEQ